MNVDGALDMCYNKQVNSRIVTCSCIGTSLLGTLNSFVSALQVASSGQFSKECSFSCNENCCCMDPPCNGAYFFRAPYLLAPQYIMTSTHVKREFQKMVDCR